MKNTGFRKTAFICLALLFAAGSCSPRPNTIKGRVKGLTNDTVFVMLVSFNDLNQRPLQDTLLTENGRFEYKLPTDGAQYGVMFRFPQLFIHNRPTGGIYTPDNANLTFISEPGGGIRFKCEINPAGLHNLSVAGSDLNRNFAKIQNEVFEINKNQISEEMSLEQAVVDKDKEAENLGWLKRRERVNALREVYGSYIRTNLNDPLSAFLLCQQPLDSVSLYYDKLGENARNSIFRSMLDRTMERSIEYAKAMKAKEKVIVSGKAPDFSLKDMTGETVTLSSMLGKDKYIIIDFWGSWCGPCLMGIPKMKGLYDKYKGKVEIVGVACKETSGDAWMEAVKKHELPWINVYDDRSSAVNVKYGIEGYPTKIVTDSQGTILIIEIGEGNNFYTKLEALLNS